MLKKRVLVVHFSQTGQLNKAIKQCTLALQEDKNVDIEFLELRPTKSFPFPWKISEFLSVFPESVYCDEIELEEFHLKQDEYDLIIIAYQVWFLSPSLPISTFMQSKKAGELLKNKPIITFIACRNMWIIAQEKMKKMIEKVDGILIDNIVLTDKGNSFETFITTPRWMLTGKKDSFFGMSEAGISNEDIENSSRFGNAISKALKENKEKEFKPILKNLGAVNVNEKMIMSEKIGHRSFLIWGKFLRKLGKKNIMLRKIALYIYMVFLILMIITVVPISVFIRVILYPVLKPTLEKQKLYFEEPSGSKYIKGI